MNDTTTHQTQTEADNEASGTSTSSSSSSTAAQRPVEVHAPASPAEAEAEAESHDADADADHLSPDTSAAEGSPMTTTTTMMMDDDDADDKSAKKNAGDKNKKSSNPNKPDNKKPDVGKGKGKSKDPGKDKDKDKGKDKEKDTGGSSSSNDEDTFDPAVDLPAYRAGMDWFVLRVASNKESYVRETLLRKVQIEGLSERVGRIMVPTEKTKTIKGGKARISETKLYPGYVFVEMKLEDDGRIPQDVFFLIKETTGVGDFVGTAGRPTPMSKIEVEKMLHDSRRPDETPEIRMEFQPGDNVQITEGPFASYDGTVDEVMPDKGKVRVLVTIFGRQAPVELEYWQIQRAGE